MKTMRGKIRLGMIPATGKCPSKRCRLACMMRSKRPTARKTVLRMAGLLVGARPRNGLVARRRGDDEHLFQPREIDRGSRLDLLVDAEIALQHLGHTGH